MGLFDHIAAEGLWLQAWVWWLVIANTAAVAFVVARVEARWALAAWIGIIVFMPLLYEQVGYVRLLGLVHIVFWTPLLIYLWQRRQLIPRTTVAGIWLHVVFVTDLASLAMDYTDLVRYLLGDGQLA